jgi:hypothetical protein
LISASTFSTLSSVSPACLACGMGIINQSGWQDFIFSGAVLLGMSYSIEPFVYSSSCFFSSNSCHQVILFSPLIVMRLNRPGDRFLLIQAGLYETEKE